MNRYVRVKKIGEGSFGKALLVKKKSDGKHYVIKEINISKMSQKEREASRKEVKVLAQLKHPNIVSYQESFEENGNLYIVMDYCEGGDLYKRINSQRGMQFSEEQAMDWFVQICLAMKHVHDRKILHRDLKSQNIFLTKNGMVKLGDFGIARVLHSTVELARTCIGTPYYLSPEICENRPYNNKSDIWSLGCVLYELLTLKHAFEAGNMKNLVLKIIRGSYPPIPLRYSSDVRVLVSQLLKRNPRDRPSVNSILRKPFIQKRIEKFLSQELIEDEFSHTVIHRKPLGVAGQKGMAAKPARASKPPAPKITEPSAKYGVSVAKKKPAVKKPGSNEGARKPSKPSGAEAARYGAGRPLDARERRRREMAQQQDQAYQDYMRKVQQQRWDRQQQEQMKRAREMGWKATLVGPDSPGDSTIPAPSSCIAASLDKLQGLCLSSSLLLSSCTQLIDLLRVMHDSAWKENKPADPPVAAMRAANQQDVVFKKPELMQKYQGKDKPARPVSAHDQKPGKPVQPARPVSASNARAAAPKPAWEAARQGEINRALGGAASEQARVREEFFMRKREAAMNKARGRADYGNYGGDHWPPAAQPEPKIARNADKARGNVEKDYLARLEAIRRQNFQERRAIQNRMAGVRDPTPARAKEEKAQGDPRYDPEARRKKIAALKSQAEERAVILRKQLEAKKKAILQKLNEEGKQKVEQERKREEQNKRPLPARAVVEERPRDETPAAPPMGVETALKNIGVTKFFRSSSENDIAKLQEEEEEQEHAPRKQWGVPFQPRMLPLEVTASAMEATSAADVVERPGASPARKQWGAPQKTQIVSALGQVTLQSACATTTMSSKDESDAATKDKTAAKSGEPTTQSAMGVTVTVTKGPAPPLMGVTVTRSPAKGGTQTPASPGQAEVVPSSKPAPSAGAIPEGEEEEVEEIPTITPREPTDSAPRSPIKAWGEEAKAAPADKGPGAVPKSPRSPKEQKSPTANRASYDQFLKSTREETKQQPLFEKVAIPQDKPKSEDHDVQMEDVSLDELSFHTADGSFEKSFRGALLSSGSYDTDTERLRTCSLPDLRLLFRTVAPEWQPPVPEDQDDDDDGDDVERESDEEEEQGEGDDLEGEDEDDDEDEELPVGSDDDDESNEYEHMLASMRDVLVSSARSPSPVKSMRATLGSLDWDHSADTSAGPVDEEDNGGAERPESELSNLNEDWQSDDEEDGEDGDGGNKEKRDRKASDDDESVFHRLEESRQMLEQELGINRFLRVYRFLQAVQENEDDNADVGSAAEISDLLGEKEHLYPKILYLVIADSAYVEDNQ